MVSLYEGDFITFIDDPVKQSEAVSHHDGFCYDRNGGARR